jgi:hypothetical protein
MMTALDPAAVRKAAAFVEALNDVCERFGATLWPSDEDGAASLPFAFDADESPTWRAEPLTPQAERFGLALPGFTR